MIADSLREAQDTRFVLCAESPVGCGHRKSTDDFDFSKTVTYQRRQYLVCNACRVTWSERKANLVKLDKQEELMGAATRTDEALVLNCPNITDLWQEILATFGDIRGFATFWVNQIKVAGSEHPGGSRVLDGMGALGRVCYAATIQQNNLIAADKKTDDDLIAERERLLDALAERTAAMLMDRGQSMNPKDVKHALLEDARNKS